MRKVLSFVLVLSLVLGSFSFAFAGTGAGDLTDIAGKDCEDAVNVLAELEVVTGYPDGTYKPENIVTRAEMAVIIIKAMGLEGFAAGSKSNFKDMAGYDWAQSYVGYAQSRGIIAGYPDGTFKPGQTVSYNEAAKMLVAAVGYPLSVLQGVWPANYVNKAQDLGILDGIAASAAGANRADIAIMTYQTLDVPMVRVDNDNNVVLLEGVWNPPAAGAAGFFSPVTLMTKLGVEDFTQAGMVAADKGQFVVNGDEDSVINLRPYIGKLVTAYANDDDEILAIKEVKSTTLTGDYVVADNVLDVDGVEYDLAGATLNFNTYVGAANFTNGSDVVAALAAPAIARTYTISADVSGKKIKDIYSVSVWNVTEHDFWDADYAADVTGMERIMNVDFALDDDDKIDLDSFDLLGAKDLASIPKDAVVYVYEGKVDGDDVVTKIEVGTKVVTGEITKLKDNGTAAVVNDDKYTIAGVTYEVAAQDDGFTVPDAGDEVKISLDYAGEVYGLDMVSGDADKVAIVTNLVPGVAKAARVAEEAPQLELILADGTVDTLDIDYSELTDNTGATVMTSITTFVAALTIGDFIEYEVDAKGKITNIELATSQLAVATAATTDVSDAGFYNGRKIASDAVVFTYDNASAAAGQKIANMALGTATVVNTDHFEVTTLDKIKGVENATGYYYFVDNSATGNIAALILDAGATGGDDVYGVVVDKGDNNSDAKHYAEVIVDGVNTTYNCKAVAGLNFTTVYDVNFDSIGNVDPTPVVIGTDAVVGSYFDVDSDVVPDGLGFTIDVNSSKFAIFGATSDEAYKGANLNVAGTYAAGQTLSIATGFYLDADCDYYLWNATDGAYEKGTLSDLKGKDLAKVIFFDLGNIAAGDNDGVIDLVLITTL